MKEDIENVEVTNNEELHRFQIQLGGQFAIIPYNIKNGMIGLFHTEVPESFRGKGLATRLALYALNYARDRHLKILPYCSFIAKYIKEHPEWQPYVKHFQ
jgi:predicted GNAT family acetyltransferase